MSTRPPAVAGRFYEGHAPALRREIEGWLSSASSAAVPSTTPPPKALVLPHAGHVYSGPVAASGYCRLAPLRDTIQRVVLLGPAHRLAFRGLAVPSHAAFATPLGDVPLDRQTLDRLLGCPEVVIHDAAHAAEHALEVQLPFLQVALEHFTLVPLLTGDVEASDVASVLETLWGGTETLVIVSTDLSHYLDHATARVRDLETAGSIEALDGEALDGRRACGHVGLRALLTVARRRGLSIRRLDLRTSGDTAGPTDHVVGYGTWSLTL